MDLCGDEREVVLGRRGLSVSVKLRWYDFWVGVYIDVSDRMVYICPLPMVVIEVTLPVAITGVATLAKDEYWDDFEV